MKKMFRGLPAALMVAGLLHAAPAAAVPIVISNAGYWLETVGPNTLGLAAGGAPGGLLTTLFVANTSPAAEGGTSATASIDGTPVAPPGLSDPLLWARRAINPNAFQLQALTVNFQNGTDTASFTGRDLSGVTAMPLAQNLAIDASVDPYGPVVSWTLPSGPGIDIDRVQIVFYSNATGAEVASRVTLPGSATFIDLNGPITPGFELAINVRFVDLANDAAAFTTDNILSESRAYINYTAPLPVPEPNAAWLFGLGALGLAPVVARRNRRAAPYA